MGTPPYYPKGYVPRAAYEELRAKVEQLEGALKNAINHLNRANRHYRNDESYMKCIDYCNNVLYEQALANKEKE